MAWRDWIFRVVGKENIDFLTHTRNYLSGEVLSGVFSFATIPILTRLLAPGEYGTLAIFLSIAAVATIVLELNFRGAISRYWFETKDDFPDFLASNLLFLTLFTAFNLSLLWFVKEPLGAFFNIDATLFFLAVICACFRLPWNLNWRLLVAQKESGRYVRLQVVRSALTFAIGVSWVYVLTRDRYLGQVYGVIVVQGVLALWVSMALLKQAKRGRFRARHIRYAISFALPLLPHSLSAYILAFFDRVIVNQIEGSAATGLYSLAYDVGRIMHVIVSSMNQSWVPHFFEYREKKQFERIENLAVTSSRYIYLLAVLVVLFSPEIVKIMSGEGFHEALPLVPVIVLAHAAMFLYTLYTNYSFYAKRTWLVSAATICAGLVNVFLNYWLIPIWGYTAAAWTTWASYLLLFGLHYLNARFVLKDQVVRLGAILPWYIVTSVLCMGVVVAQRIIDDSFLSIIVVKLPVLLILGVVIFRLRKGNSVPDEIDKEDKE